MINGNCLKNAVISGANNILKNKNFVDELNIFPVPDGDTGTNMSMTISSAIDVLKDVEDETVGEVSKKVASALLRGARGNSGVILSLLFRGISKGLEGKEEANGLDLVSALGMGVEAAYKAVMKPTEGTILTVARLAHERGKIAAHFNNDAVYVWSEMCIGASDALKTTPDLLPVLKKAGVVDAGGKGLCLIFDGMLSVFKDNVIIEYNNESTKIESDDVFRSAAAEFDDDIGFTYCTEYIVGRSRLCKTPPSKLRDFLQKIGDCVVVVDDEEIIKVHVHTENPGKALQEALKFGQLLTVKVENMKEQHRRAVEANKEKLMKKGLDLSPVEPEEEVGFVAVAAGEGLCDLFKDLGCLNVISGGQTMNPSTDDILKAILATPAKVVYVFPNNKNIIMSAEQTVSLVKDRQVIIIPTRTVPQGISAILAYNADLSSEENINAMNGQIQRVSTGQITFAARDSEFGGFKIKEGEIIGLDNGKLVLKEKDPCRALMKLIKSMRKKDTQFVTIIYGEDVTEEQAQNVYEEAKNKLGNDVDVSLINGKQPIYHFVLSIE